MIRLADSRESRLREARKVRLSDAGLLDVFMVTRRAFLAKGRSVVEANERAHEAVDDEQRMRALETEGRATHQTAFPVPGVAPFSKLEIRNPKGK